MRCIAITFIGLCCFAQAQDTYKTRLSPVPSDAKTRPDVSGVGTVSAALAGTKLTVTGTFEGLHSAAVIVRLHDGVATGARGPAIQDLTASKGMSGSISGSVELKPEQIEHLKKGRLYIELYGEKTPDGAIWGWLTH